FDGPDGVTLVVPLLHPAVMTATASNPAIRYRCGCIVSPYAPVVVAVVAHKWTICEPVARASIGFGSSTTIESTLNLLRESASTAGVVLQPLPAANPLKLVAVAGGAVAPGW